MCFFNDGDNQGATSNSNGSSLRFISDLGNYYVGYTNFIDALKNSFLNEQKRKTKRLKNIYSFHLWLSVVEIDRAEKHCFTVEKFSSGKTFDGNLW